MPGRIREFLKSLLGVSAIFVLTYAFLIITP